MIRSFSSESKSELLWSLDLEQPPWPSDNELPSDLESNSASSPSPKLKSASHSDVGGSIEDEKLWPSSIMYAWGPSDSEMCSTTHSELKCAINDEELLPTNVMQMYPSEFELRSSSHSGVQWSTDDEQPLSSNLKQTRPSDSEPQCAMVSLHDEEEINVVITNDASEDGTVAEPPKPKRRSFLSALGRRVLSATRKLFCCGGVCGRNRKR
ncbi:hypothetical protein QTP88_024050 [Uroleucon formosanum]